MRTNRAAWDEGADSEGSAPANTTRANIAASHATQSTGAASRRRGASSHASNGAAAPERHGPHGLTSNPITSHPDTTLYEHAGRYFAATTSRVRSQAEAKATEQAT